MTSEDEGPAYLLARPFDTIRATSSLVWHERSLMTQVSSLRRIWLAALGLGLGVDLLFYGKEPGISVPIFVALAVAALFGLGGTEGSRPIGRNLWLLGPLLFFAAMVAIRANVFLTVLNITAAFVLLCMVAYFYGDGRVESLGMFGYPVDFAHTVVNLLAGAATVVPAGVPVDALKRGSWFW